MISIPGRPGVNIWNTEEELRARARDGAEHAEKLFPGDRKWRRRVINLAVGTGVEKWALAKTFEPATMKVAIEYMMKWGFPADAEHPLLYDDTVN